MSLSLSKSAHVTLLALLSATTLYCFYKSRKLKSLKSPKPSSNPGKLFYISQTGTSKALALRLFDLLTSHNLPFQLVDPAHYEPEDLAKEDLVIIVTSTWEDGKPPSNGTFLANWLAESAEDFRVGSLLLSKCRFAVFGVGSAAYGERFNVVGREFSSRLKALGATEIAQIGDGDVESGDLDDVFDIWSENVVKRLKGSDGVKARENCCNGGGEESDYDEEEVSDNEEEGIVDLEDIAGKGPSRKSVKEVSNGKVDGVKEMVTPVIRASLEKQVKKSACIINKPS